MDTSLVGNSLIMEMSKNIINYPKKILTVSKEIGTVKHSSKKKVISVTFFPCCHLLIPPPNISPGLTDISMSKKVPVGFLC
jgi:hypothetical protein